MRFASAFVVAALAAWAQEAAVVEQPPPPAQAVPAAPACLCEDVKTQAENVCKEQLQRESKGHAAALEATESTLAQARSALAQAQQSLGASQSANKKLTDAKAELEKLKDSLASQVASLNTQISGLKDQVNSLTAESSKAQEFQKAQLSAQIQLLQEQTQTLTTKLEAEEAEKAAALAQVQQLTHTAQSAAATESALSQCQTKRAELESEIAVGQRKQAQHAEVHSALQRQLSASEAKLHSTIAAHEKMSNEIYNTQQFSRQLRHTASVSKALLGYTHLQFVKVIGRNNYDLVVLQASMSWHYVADKVDQYTKPLRTKAQEAYSQHLHPVVAPKLSQLQTQFSRVASYAKERAYNLMGAIDARMDRMVTNLSSVDPQVSSIFPEGFADRCVAFAFLSACLYIVSEGVQLVLKNTLVPVGRKLLGIPKSSKRRSSRSSATKSVKPTKGGPNASNPTTTKSGQPTPAKKASKSAKA
eukprot:Protomagalhaensia_wolfi_Nauph_80__4949@NODE_521_length_2386_cov_147_198125_g374_i3_p1_GENE_NODE_521_length_2386_cov_147_198125_g374_i3NODE_521_length_2386_cov_147_198125_g374_i3_p1_ORF_typecomplete_len474_score120_26HOOK/PF05622_12/8_5e08CCCAP/PF15964_5/0_00013CALCOCO1/PF07888_11/0_00059MAD/PF05557_13/0_00046MAD/PF05557_13/47TPR_MLP1_2/PF07926_12/0_0014TPR_MLP1_2/PF07926_12/4_7e03Myosin_tail_1/PF01576_19/0_028FlxA/PF14282_6/0_0022FlxA/PF14282_6/4_6e03FlxA/PF14282_6/2_5e03FlxA/PF14282_6/3_8e03Tra